MKKSKMSEKVARQWQNLVEVSRRKLNNGDQSEVSEIVLHVQNFLGNIIGEVLSLEREKKILLEREKYLMGRLTEYYYATEMASLDLDKEEVKGLIEMSLLIEQQEGIGGA